MMIALVAAAVVIILILIPGSNFSGAVGSDIQIPTFRFVGPSRRTSASGSRP